MFRTFAEIEKYILESGKVTKIALCGSQDEPALSALAEARRKGLVSGILIGDVQKTKVLLEELGEREEDYEIIEEADERAAADMAVAMCRNGRADIPMKGLMMTASYMRAILDKTTGILPEGKILSECTVFEYPQQNRLMLATDCAVNILPGLEEKTQIIENAAELARCLGIENAKVAIVSALEKVNPKIPSTVEAEKLTELSWEDCTVDGPFALDNAVSPEAAQHKGIEGAVAGKADILVMPDLCSGNILHKSLGFFADYEMAGVLCGAAPVIMTSRTDSPRTKYHSILIAVLRALRLAA